MNYSGHVSFSSFGVQCHALKKEEVVQQVVLLSPSSLAKEIVNNIRKSFDETQQGLAHNTLFNSWTHLHKHVWNTCKNIHIFEFWRQKISLLFIKRKLEKKLGFFFSFQDASSSSVSLFA